MCSQPLLAPFNGRHRLFGAMHVERGSGQCAGSNFVTVLRRSETLLHEADSLFPQFRMERKDVRVKKLSQLDCF